MKTLNFLTRSGYAMAFLLLMVSCSSEDADTTGDQTPQSLELSSDAPDEDFRINETVSFVVKGSDGKIYTSSSKILVNGEPISGRTFVFTEAGEYSFQATYKNVSSNILNYVATGNASSAGNPTSIELNSVEEKDTYHLQDEITFEVIGDNGEDYTLTSQFYLNGEEINGNKFSFSDGGSFTFNAKYQGLTSNEVVVNVAAENYLTINFPRALRNQEITFTSYGTNKEDQTGSSTFYINNAAIAGNTFSSSTAGSFEVYAITGDGNQTPSETFEVFVPVRKVLFEDYTGTWCGWCPRVTETILELKSITNNISVVAYHLNDDLEFQENWQLASFLGITSLPHARYNRANILPFPENEEDKIKMVADIAGTPAATSVGINTNYSGSSVDVEVKVISEENLSSDHKLSVFLLQNNIVYPQDNYLNTDSTSPWFQMGDPIVDFIHDDVVEHTFTNILGDPLPAINAAEEFVINFDSVELSQFSYYFNSNSFDPNNFEIVAIVMDGDGHAINSRKVKVGKNAAYE